MDTLDEIFITKPSKVTIPWWLGFWKPAMLLCFYIASKHGMVHSYINTNDLGFVDTASLALGVLTYTALNTDHVNAGKFSLCSVVSSVMVNSVFNDYAVWSSFYEPQGTILVMTSTLLIAGGDLISTIVLYQLNKRYAEAAQPASA